SERDKQASARSLRHHAALHSRTDRLGDLQVRSWHKLQKVSERVQAEHGHAAVHSDPTLDGHILEASLKLDCRGITGKQNLNAVVLQLLLDLRGIIHNQGSVTMDEEPSEIGDTVELEEQLSVRQRARGNDQMDLLFSAVIEQARKPEFRPRLWFKAEDFAVELLSALTIVHNQRDMMNPSPGHVFSPSRLSATAASNHSQFRSRDHGIENCRYNDRDSSSPITRKNSGSSTIRCWMAFQSSVSLSSFRPSIRLRTYI